MTTISNLNIVIQQGDVARDAQQLKAGHQDASQVAASVQPDKQVKERTQVQQTPDSSKSKWEKDKGGSGRKRSAGKKRSGKKRIDKNNKSDHLLDTIV